MTSAVHDELTRVFAREWPGSTVDDVRVLAGGRSALTAAATVRRGGTAVPIAVRAVPRDRPGLRIGTLGDQFRLLESLYADGIPVPRPILVAEDEDAAYDLIVTEFVAGEVPHPWRRAGRERVAALRANEGFKRDFVETLARIHAVPPSALPPGLAHDGVDAARSHPARSRERSLTAVAAAPAFRDDPVLAYTGCWLVAHEPAARFRAGLVHGDYRVGNLVLRDDRLAGVLDWELAEAGETLSDVAWLCGPQGGIDGRAAGLFTEDDLVARYARASGREIDPGLFRYLRVEGTLRTASVWAQLSEDERRRGDDLTAARCRDSVVSLVGLCGAVLELGGPRPDPATPLGRALAAGTDATARDLEREIAAAADVGQATRNARLFLRRLSTAFAADDYPAFAARCAALAARYRAAHPSADLPDGPAGRTLAAVVRHGFAVGATDDLAAETRALVGWAARPSVAFLNHLLATEGEPC